MLKRKLIVLLCALGLPTSAGMTTGCGGSVVVGGEGQEYFLDFDVLPDPYVGPALLDFLYFRSLDEDDREDYFEDLYDD